nr:GNAT family N-acetyltransferase [Naumannella cuiyingiana]
MRADFDESPVDPSEHAVIGSEGGSVVAYGWNHPRAGDVDPVRVVLTGVVHPAWRYHRIGRGVFEWQLRRAREHHRETGASGGLRVEAYADEHLNSRRRLYERNGLAPLRWFSDLHVQLDRAGERPIAPDPVGIELVPFTAALSEPVRLAHNDAFAQGWGSQPVPPDAWRQSIERRAARPEWSWVALSRGEVVGYALNSATAQEHPGAYAEGWTDRLGVRPDWRGRGVARALLQRTLASFATAGLDGGGLGVDATERRFELYESVGYEVTDTVLLYGREQ